MQDGLAVEEDFVGPQLPRIGLFRRCGGEQCEGDVVVSVERGVLLGGDGDVQAAVAGADEPLLPGRWWTVWAGRYLDLFAGARGFVRMMRRALRPSIRKTSRGR
ncbi:hypothetical protein [Streptomyces sp. NPDC052701]|uniref:hypothetical protein n=1 Tax=Streptomyces sp. NPDC052701 TaxID=3155533 RepID=UPI0034180AD5